ncbi:MAG: hypothetical protein J7J75_03695 [Euryarchaeota archaeon]|nr:hypothetical protein [Euryarchaeota archaeon]RLF66440.1 MAG: hypothetical protein DRN26_04000 [Thermoplasmata archaeon]
MPKAEIDKEKGEVRIAIDKTILERLEKAVEVLEELKKQVPEIPRPKIEEVIASIAEAKEKLIPKVDVRKIIEIVKSSETELHIKFDKLTLDGEVTIKFAPLRKE